MHSFTTDHTPWSFLERQRSLRTTRRHEARIEPLHTCASCGASSREADLQRTYGGEDPEFTVAFCAECLDHGRPEDEIPGLLECGGEG